MRNDSLFTRRINRIMTTFGCNRATAMIIYENRFED